jgi:hypothetical protein
MRLLQLFALVRMRLAMTGANMLMRTIVWHAASCLVCIAAMSAAAAPFETTFRFVPAAPRYMEDVRLRIEPAVSDCFRQGNVSMSGNAIRVAVDRFVELCAMGAADYDLGRLPAGHYTVEVVHAAGGSPIWAGTFNVAPRDPGNNARDAASDVNYTDVWWDPARPGWGVFISHRPDEKLFAAWFDYGADGQPVWYTFLGTNQARGDFAGQVMRSQAGSPANPPFVASSSPVVVGQARFLFGDARAARFSSRYDEGRMSVVIDGVQRETAIVRFDFD